MILDPFFTILRMSSLRKVAIFTKRVILDEIFIFRDSLIPEYQLIDENENIAERDFFGLRTFRSGLKNAIDLILPTI